MSLFWGVTKIKEIKVKKKEDISFFLSSHEILILDIREIPQAGAWIYLLGRNTQENHYL